MRRIPGAKIPIQPKSEPPKEAPTDDEGADERARKPKARAKLKFGPGKA